MMEKQRAPWIVRMRPHHHVFVIRQSSARLRAIPSPPGSDLLFPEVQTGGEMAFFPPSLKETSPQLVQLHEVCRDVVNLKI